MTNHQAITQEWIKNYLLELERLALNFPRDSITAKVIRHRAEIINDMVETFRNPYQEVKEDKDNSFISNPPE